MSPNDDLWQRLEAFELNVEGASLPFCARLARDNNWSLDFAARVALEYKKFLYLACTAGHPVTPSDEVDQAWHLHLTYSRSYWDELCAKVLERPLHHDPTRGGKSEGQKFENWYERTKASYHAAFGEDPPADIWPPSHIRFGEASHFRRVNLRHCFILPRPSWRLPQSKGQVAFKIVPAALLLMILAGCSRSGSLNPFDWYGDEFLALYWPLCAVLFGGALWFRSQGRGPHDEVFPAVRPSAYALTRLADAKSLSFDTVICSLQWQGRIVVDTYGNVATVPGTEPPQNSFERRVWDKIRAGIPLQRLREWTLFSLGELDHELEKLGFLLPLDKRWSLNSIPLAVTAFLIAVGLSKLVVGLQRDRPVGLLVATCFALAVAAIFAVTKYSPRRTVRGERYLSYLRDQHKRQRPSRFEPHINPEIIVLGAALWGYTELNSFGFTPLRTHARHANASDSSSSNSSGGGGDSGGYYGCSSGSSSGGSSSGGDSGGSDGGGGCGGCGGGGCGGGG